MTAATAREPTPAAHTPAERPPLRRWTRIAGTLYLVIFLVYPLATLVRSSLIVPGDAAATAISTTGTDM